MRMTRSSLLAYALLIFASGAVLGLAVSRLFAVTSVSAKDWRQRYTAEMAARLQLAPGQVTKLNAILDETRTRVHEVREKSRPEMEAIHREQDDKIRAMLTDAQRPDFEKLREEREKRSKRR